MTAVGGQPFRGTRPPPSKLRGSVGEAWAGETQIVLFYSWVILGSAGGWKGDARKFKAFSDLPTQEVRLRFFVTQRNGGGDTLLELEGRGHLIKKGEVLEFKGTGLTVV